MKQKLKLSFMFAVIALAAGCSGQGEENAAMGAQGMPPPKVSVISLETQLIANEVALPGRITPYRQSQVRPQVDGVITKRLFEEGAHVEQGEQLYQIDDARYKAQLNAAVADVKSAQANLNTLDARLTRYQDLIKKNAISQQEFDDVKAQREQAVAAISVAEAAVELARVNLNYTKMYAPISGQISRSFVTEGALVNANQSQQLATITQLHPIFVDMQESGSAILDIRRQLSKEKELPVKLTLDEVTGEVFNQTGKLKFSEVTVDQTTGSVTLRAEIPNPESLLMPGLFVKAHVVLDTSPELLVPQRATTRQPDGSLKVFVVNSSDQVEGRTLKSSRTYKDQYVVEGGLNEGDRVIVTGYQKTSEGMTVTPIAWQRNSEDKVLTAQR
ncbi:efflux RND transporter periplasmic adaptor subunit [Glaciecola sp. 1036]|uniref:efflux RND transporter periplasmic adaptor subunit n=1 Tax=Alteromonadaceae TaxID=72275 RepID=UPI003D067999